MERNLKECQKCFELKDVKHFGANKKTKDGKKRYCKACISIMNSDNYNKKRDKKIDQVLSWQEINAEKVREYKRNYARKKRQKG